MPAHSTGNTHPLSTLLDHFTLTPDTTCRTCGEPECQCELCEECDRFCAPSDCLVQPHTGEVVCNKCLCRAHRDWED